VQGFDTFSSAFPVFENVKQQWNEYSVGILADWAGLRFIARHTWISIRTIPTTVSPAPRPPAWRLIPRCSRHSNVRNEPWIESGWFGNVYGSHKYWALNARLTYNLGTGGFALNEVTTGLNSIGAAENRQVVVSGDAQRPVVAGDFSFSVFPTSRLSIVNNTAVHDTRIDGDSSFTEFDNGTGTSTTLNFKFLGVRTVANSTDLNYRFNNWFSAYAGFTDSDARFGFWRRFRFRRWPAAR